jgi:hypothetical protein
MAWTPNEQTTTLQMWDTGSSALDISRTLGTKTRNAVIGWLNRQGIGDKDRSVSYTMMQERRRRNKAEFLALKRTAMRELVAKSPEPHTPKARKMTEREARRFDHRAMGRVGFMNANINERSPSLVGVENPLLENYDLLRHSAPMRGGELIPGPEGINTLNVKRAECRWPMSMEPRKSSYTHDAPDMGEDALCGHVTAHASPYCQHHAGRAAKPKGGEA